MRKPEIVSAIADQADISKESAQQALNALIDVITNALKEKDSVNLIGFGTFTPRSRAARTGKNPQTGETLQIPASNTVGFKPGKNLKDAVN